MNKNTKFGIELLARIDSGHSLNEITQCVFQTLSEYSFNENAEVVTKLLDLMREKIDPVDISQSEEREELLRILLKQSANEMLEHLIF